jgi:hypothetical protein
VDLLPSILVSHELEMRINELENGLSQAQGAHEMSSMDVQEALQRFLVVSDGSLPV